MSLLPTVSSDPTGPSPSSPVKASNLTPFFLKLFFPSATSARMAPFCVPLPLLLLYPIVALFFLALRAAWELTDGGGEIICWIHGSPGRGNRGGMIVHGKQLVHDDQD